MTKPKEHRVVSRNFCGTFTVCYTGIRAACFRWIINRSRGHIPPFYAVTTRSADFEKCF